MKYLLFNFDDISEEDIDAVNDTSELSDEEFEAIVRRSPSGLIYTSTEDFESGFNGEMFSVHTHQIRIVEDEKMNVEFGEDFVRISDEDDNEIVYWHQDEWIEDFEVAFSIMNAIKLAATSPAQLRKLLKIGF